MNLIQHGMLIVEGEIQDERNAETDQRGGIKTKRQRRKSCDIWKELQSMYIKCLESEDYALKSLN